MQFHRALVAAFVTGAAAITPAAAESKMPIAQFGDNKVKLEVAVTPKEIEHGLMGRTALGANAGMVFIFDPPRPVRFWMAHCFISLDMIFIKDGRIANIAASVPPCKAANEADCPTYPDEGPVDASEVVEVNAGYCKQHNIKIGDPVKFLFLNRTRSAGDKPVKSDMGIKSEEPEPPPASERRKLPEHPGGN